MQDVNYLYEIFYSLEVWGLIGPVAIVALGVMLAQKKKTKPFALLYTIPLLIVGFTYFDMFANIDPAYIWKAVIVVFGGMFGCFLPSVIRK
jgi:hypothetical protein